MYLEMICNITSSAPPPIDSSRPSMAKLKAGPPPREAADSCLQYWGGPGYMWESPVARAYRDGRLLSIGGGADEVMLGIICKLEGTLPGSE